MLQMRAPAAKPLWQVGTALAVLAGAVYLSIGLGLVAEDFESPPAPVMTLAGIAYIVGGGLIPFVGRRLLTVGAVVNVVVIVLFLASAARGTATIDVLSLSGKTAQVALGVYLFWLLRRG